MRKRSPAAGRADPDFPWLPADRFVAFPPPDSASPEGILCVGGNLSPGMLLSAYRQGAFPWFNEEDPLLWWSPDPRFVLPPAETHASATMKKIIRKRRYALSLDTAFGRVIRACKTAYRPGQRGTWIQDDMVQAYEELHALGYAHSVEAWQDGRLVGGLYGIALGGVFFGESMFSLADDASKAAFIPFAWRLADEGFILIDSQVRTDHVASMGGREIPRPEYLATLSRALGLPDRRGDWGAMFPGFPASRAYDALVGPTP